jgi:hypothetical protein
MLAEIALSQEGLRLCVSMFGRLHGPEDPVVQRNFSSAREDSNPRRTRCSHQDPVRKSAFT